jgi:hypothetical protein
MEEILQRITTLQTEGGLEPPDLLLTFLVARVSPLQRCSHKMCFLGSARDPTRHSSKALSALEEARKANRIADVKLQISWTWGLEPHDRDNLIAEVSSPGLALVLLPLLQLRSPNFCLLGPGRTCLLCRLRRILPSVKPALPLTEPNRMTKSFGMKPRR